jgi:hypothetical protein
LANIRAANRKSFSRSDIAAIAAIGLPDPQRQEGRRTHRRRGPPGLLGRACGPWNFMKNPDGWADPLVRPRGVGLRPAMPAFLRASASREDAARNGGMASRRLAPQTRTDAGAGFSTLPLCGLRVAKFGLLAVYSLLGPTGMEKTSVKHAAIEAAFGS